MSIVKWGRPREDNLRGHTRLRILVGILLSILFSFPVLAAEKVVLTEDLSVYSSARTTLNPKYRLRRGQSILINSAGKNGYRVVRGKVGKQTVTGFAREDDLGNYIEVDDGAPSKQIGVSFIYSQLSQKNHEFQASEDATYNISKFTGSSIFFRAFYDHRISPTLVTRISLVRRETKSDGEAAVSGSSTSSSIELTQSFLGGQAELLYSSGMFWFGAGFEASKGMAVNIKTKSGPVIEDDQVEKPFFVVLSAGAGAYLGPIASSIYFMPELRLGMVVSTDPMTQVAEVVMNVGYRL